MNQLSYISIAIITNGLYDILCSLSILKIIYIPILGKLHLSMLRDYHPNSVFERFFAYSILVNGLIRTIGGLTLSNNNSSAIVCGSYILEAITIGYETFFQDTIILEKGVFVSTTSLLLAYLSLHSYLF